MSNNIQVKFYHHEEIPDEKLKYAVIVSRYGGFIFCRHKERTTWEIPGGHREPGETIEKAARRELFEETGALEFELSPICIYGVGDDYGMLFFAEIEKMGSIPEDSEIAEVCYREKLPENMTYPLIQPHLLRTVNVWLCNQSSKGELWDIYDEGRNKTGRLHRRGNLLNSGEYHLVVHIWMRNSDGEFLITKRAAHKGFPNMWESTGGSALAGDDSLTAALREVEEETGLILSPKNGKIIHSYKRHSSFVDVWLFEEDHDLCEVILNAEETVDKMYASSSKIREMIKTGDFIDFSYIDVILNS